ncbi:EVE domain-containing protein [Deinococcus irradiatisoli]|uniref:EVE domain-containing protein n=1 Tax=Deinococcus irradiatisoli TaxID=2202254 RepID=A0A2Z3JDJ9_9DEIO|nr:EVE domain-containing protein [Deinococcus irradiatisoli]AWN23025.1 EVE domain-containing protein [Deinococcus irradiatisoli]
MSAEAYWLLKSEPDVFSYADLERVGTEPWNGVRNYQARNFLRAMQVGDRCLFYHSSTGRVGVAGVGRVVRAAYPDDLQFDPLSPYFDSKSTPEQPRWSMVDVAAVSALPRFVALEELRAVPELAQLRLLQKGNRLSVMPVRPEEFELIVALGGLHPEAL